MKLLKALLLLSFANCLGQDITISDVTVVEGDTAHFVVTLGEPSTAETQVDLIVAVSKNFDDFELLSGAIVIPAGQTTGTFDVATTEDDHGEATEYGEICPYITNPQISYNCGRLTILDDDPNIVGEIIALDDVLTFPLHIVVTFYSILSNDTINGIPATFDSVILTPITLPEGFSIQSESGRIQLQGNEPPGVYTITYQLCAISDPSNCTTGTVTITLYDPLKLDAFVFENLKSYPNPVKSILSIANTSTIDAIEITSVLGQPIFSKKVNELQTEINLSEFSSGIYFVKITAQGKEKTIKILKN